MGEKLLKLAMEHRLGMAIAAGWIVGFKLGGWYTERYISRGLEKIFKGSKAEEPMFKQFFDYAREHPDVKVFEF